jgi:hypothetical protein
MIAALIPTRNRDALAEAAVRSLRDQDCELEIFVSDNSSTPGTLPGFCREQGVHYLRPDGELSNADHWDWALRQVLDRSGATHITVHRDREWSKRGSWGALGAKSAQHPRSIVSFAVDSITNTPPPLRLWQPPWSGKLLRIRTARVAELIASGRFLQAGGQALPWLVNCVVPRPVLQSLLERFGDICRGASPDIAFIARVLGTFDHYLHADVVPAVLYAPDRSTSTAYLRGGGPAYDDFRKLHGEGAWLELAPVPGIDLGSNMILHEYERVRRATNGRLPPLDDAACRRELAASLRAVPDPDRRAELARALGIAVPKPYPRLRWAWGARQALVCGAARLGIRPRNSSGFAFPDDAAALQHALRHPRARRGNHRHLALLEPEEIR